MTAQDAIDAALSTTKHWRLFAPHAPLERFIAQEVLFARADAFEGLRLESRCGGLPENGTRGW